MHLKDASNATSHIIIVPKQYLGECAQGTPVFSDGSQKCMFVVLPIHAIHVLHLQYCFITFHVYVVVLSDAHQVRVVTLYDIN